MTSLLRSTLAAAALAAATVPALALSANDAGDLVRAQILIGKVMQVVEKYRQVTVPLEAPQPMAGNQGRYLVPYKASGELTPWAAKIVGVAASKVVGEKVGEKATEALASKVPFGGLAGGLLKKKSKEVAANALLGGPEFIKQNSDLSFTNLDDYAVYLHVRHSGDGTYQQAVAAAMALYPELEGRFEGAVKNAYRTQSAKAGQKVP